MVHSSARATLTTFNERMLRVITNHTGAGIFGMSICSLPAFQSLWEYHASRKKSLLWQWWALPTTEAWSKSMSWPNWLAWCVTMEILPPTQTALFCSFNRVANAVFLWEARLGKSYGCYATKTLIKVGFKSLNFLGARFSWSKDKPPTLQCSVETSLCKQL